MPYRRRGYVRRSFKRKRSYGRPVRRRNMRRRRKYRRYRRLPILTGVGRSKLVRLRYAEEYTLTPGLGTYGLKVFSANSAFSPGGGSSPNAFAEWAAFYNHYLVIGARIRTQPFPLDTTNTNPTGYWTTFMCRDSATTPLPGKEILENKRSGFGQLINVLGSHGSNIQTFMLGSGRSVRKYSAKKFWKRQAIDPLTTGAQSTANPAQIVEFRVLYTGVGTNIALPMHFVSVIDMLVLWSLPKILV